jgi:hypothetical protein
VEAWGDYLDPQTGQGSKLSPLCRARLSHKIRSSHSLSKALPFVGTDAVARFISDGCPGPSPAEQAVSLIRLIGDEISRTGEKLKSLPKELFSIIGSPSPTLAGELAIELLRNGSINGTETKSVGSPPSLLQVNLTLIGWQQYESEKRGNFSGRRGFLAMKFNDTELEEIVKDVLKPAIRTGLNYDLVDVRDVSRAGIIDNIIRAQIRDSAFVIVDLTHDNSGAYWEAGYAEGLGKPVIYICERKKFEDMKTHFDTNHCTTVLWSKDEQQQFSENLIATLRRSLNLF